MNTAHWHMLLNHLPIVGVVIGTLILFAGYVLRNNSTIKKTALGVFVFAALMAIPAYLTGEGAEDLVEKMPGVTDSGIESHEDTGQLFLIVVCVLAGLSILTFLTDWFKSKIASLLYGVVLVAGLGACVFAKQVGTSGGEVRHTEIRSGAAQQPGQLQEQNGGQIDDD